MSFHVPEKLRVRSGYMASSEANGNNGAFFLRLKPGEPPLQIIASDGAIHDGGDAWEHVSVSLPHRLPTWDEMCRVKDLFWDDSDCVVQFHPPRSDYVNNHSRCLHLWRLPAVEFPRPPALMVGYADLGVIA